MDPILLRPLGQSAASSFSDRILPTQQIYSVLEITKPLKKSVLCILIGLRHDRRRYLRDKPVNLMDLVVGQRLPLAFDPPVLDRRHPVREIVSYRHGYW